MIYHSHAPVLHISFSISAVHTCVNDILVCERGVQRKIDIEGIRFLTILYKELTHEPRTINHHHPPFLLFLRSRLLLSLLFSILRLLLCRITLMRFAAQYSLIYGCEDTSFQGLL